MKIPNNVLKFAGEENLAPYKMFVDYYNHYKALNGDSKVEYQKYSIDENGKEVELTFAEKEDKLNAALKREIMRAAGITNFDAFPVAAWQSHPTLRWASFAVVSAMIDMILPNVIVDTMGAFSEVRNIALGDIAQFTVKPNELFVVSKASRLGKRTTELHKWYSGEVTVAPEAREMTVYVSLIKVLEGRESLAEFVNTMVRSFEYSVNLDVYTAFTAAMDSIPVVPNTGLNVAGYTAAEFARLGQAVRTWNGGSNVVAMGTQVALSKILPADANYRYDIDSDFVRLGYLNNFHGVQTMVMPQMADLSNPFGLRLPDDKIYFFSTGSQKIVKVVFEGSTLSWQDGPYDRANLMQTSTMWKSWGTGVVTNAVAGVMTV